MAVQKGHQAARSELDRIQLAKELAALHESVSLGNIDAAYQLGLHKRVDPPTQYTWLSYAAVRGHNEAIDSIFYIDLLIAHKENILVMHYKTSKITRAIH